MSIFSRLFGGGGAASEPAREPEIYKDFRIFAEPESDAGGFRIAGRIEKDIDGETRSHRFLRADTMQSKDECERFTALKAKQIIDEQGERLFD
jgi:hypothetical protein